ncbi:radical SAM family heme chaperone HemW [Luteibaculum oceani]|uniref:Heme chaperone HemW n=1 Tax=Luteibaculum oceani TaxID=1294296 RepID=A0A5C6VKE4_9FLAO|nr:radical SAM family heme chaperone HemW [Luteibaculum oceani]TXC85104.1 radical SAM family heme chaperone HemW [Luteibaculum oceani]
MDSAGLYIHIPFCRKACSYCDFHFTVNQKNRAQICDALVSEMVLWKEDWCNYHFQTLYFGGGTPSILNSDELSAVVNGAKSNFSWGDEVEFTLEINPEDVTLEKLHSWKELGVNRLSIGLQAFQDEILTWMNRAHSAEEGLRAVRLAQEVGFDNISVDLIYGIPGLTHSQWEENLTKVLELNIQHVSCYCLTVEEKTKLEQMVKNGELTMPEDEVSTTQFDMLSSFFEGNGFNHYEISNLGKPGKESKHNSNYWNGVPYLGIGPSAHSYRKGKRWWNPASNALYQKEISKGNLPNEIEILSETDAFNEKIMTGLRRKDGVSVHLWLESGESPKNILQNSVINELYREGMISLSRDRLSLTQKGRHLADGIAAKLFR